MFSLCPLSVVLCPFYVVTPSSRANPSAPSPGPSTSIRRPSIAASSRAAPYDTFLFRSAARPKDLSERDIGLRVLTGKGAQIDTTTASGRMVFGIFATLAEFERDLIRERTMAGLAAARARGRKGGRKFALTKAQVRLAQAAMAQRDTSVSDLCKELGIERVTLYRYVGPKGELREYGKRVLGLDQMSDLRRQSR